MKRNMVFGALVLSVVLTSQAFSFELLNGLLGKKCGGCCEPACCEPACNPCEPAACCEKACEPCTPAACCEKACEPACCEPNCCDPCCKPKCDLFAGLKGLFKCKKSCGGCCEPACCEPACGPCTPAACCEKACEPAGCCDDACCGETCCKPCCTPILDFLDDLCRTRIKVKLYKKPKCYTGCGDTGCCEPACCGQSGCSDCNGAPVATPKMENGNKPAPVPEPPTNAKILRTRSFYQVSRQVVRN